VSLFNNYSFELLAIFAAELNFLHIHEVYDSVEVFPLSERMLEDDRLDLHEPLDCLGSPDYGGTYPVKFVDKA
jgi:hypothetical protein